jgi:REP element-mobilizing transposase RayT
VRRAFLCGNDPVSGQCFDHRKLWILERLASLSGIFAVRVCAYAVLSNHFHLVLRIDADTARDWSDDEVVSRYTRLFRGLNDPREHLTPSRSALVIHGWRARLADLSWFMRCLNEAIARRANREDGCTGRFWEGRFRSQALLDDAGLITCMSYVDLNPIRAGLASSLEDSEFTSIRQRLAERAVPGDSAPPVATSTEAIVPPLVPLDGRDHTPGDHQLSTTLDDYVELLTATAAALRTGSSASNLDPGARRSLDDAGIDSRNWLDAIRFYHRRFFTMVGCVHRIRLYCARTDRSHAKGTSWATRHFCNRY